MVPTYDTTPTYLLLQLTNIEIVASPWPPRLLDWMLSLFVRMLPQILPPPRMAVERHLRTVALDPARMIGALLDRYGLSDGDVGNGDDGGAPYEVRRRFYSSQHGGASGGRATAMIKTDTTPDEDGAPSAADDAAANDGSNESAASSSSEGGIGGGLIPPEEEGEGDSLPAPASLSRPREAIDE